jgi:uncharacterized membrane protein YeiH
MNRDDEAARQRAIRRATRYTYGFLASAVVTAVGGGALIAWLFTRSGLPFLKTWIVVIAIVVVPSLLGLVWRAVRERQPGSGQ